MPSRPSTSKASTSRGAAQQRENHDSEEENVEAEGEDDNEDADNEDEDGPTLTKRDNLRRCSSKRICRQRGEYGVTDTRQWLTCNPQIR